ncbi:hypothetical protein [Arenibacterium halophilum]|uniref:Uncharacterized protein n=1 Tax=Arenibacterium halophilum TaxID=2583821 RepID=A0ABY2WX72_9RHOB|nr:hypothetical protein [Arenibacterium halophilum]TMV07436.1 hypothetical protein FGK64_21445 [Arenibacterium halophilum]
MIKVRNIVSVGLIGAVVAVSVCTTDQVAHNTSSTVGFVTKTAVNGTVGVGKMTMRGVQKVAGLD